MSIKYLNKTNNSIGHVIIWLLSIAFFCFIFYLNSKTFNLALIAKAFITNICFATSVYLNLHVLIPRFLKRKNYIFYIFWLITIVSATSLITQLFIIYPLRNILDISSQTAAFNTNTHSAFFFVTLIYVGVSSFLKLIKDWISMQDINYKLAQIEKQKLEAELTTLKGQLNPHFLFNSLNNIYSLALIKSDKVPELILKLSDLMRHIIYESKENYISIEKELEFVDNFIALQKIRTSDKIRIEYTKSGQIPSAKVAPLLFEPFIDNAFKHGLPGTENDDYIAINFTFTDNNHLNFHLENNYVDIDHREKKNSGIGLQNVQQRLEHLYSPEEFDLKITKQNNTFTVDLQLTLK